MIKALMEEIKEKINCKVFPCMETCVDLQVTLPDDVKDFYSLCGGMTLFEDSPYSVRIVSPDEIRPADPVIVGEEIIRGEMEKGTYENAISKDWYIIADLGNSDYIVIDMNKNRKGRCYSALWDSYPSRGDTPVIAMCFTELIERLVENNGEYWFFLQKDFHSYGDAYDSL